MTLKDLRRIPVFQARELAEDIRKEPALAVYISACLGRMYAGDYGALCQDDIDSNNQELEGGEGRIVCRYPAAPRSAMDDDIFIICYFSEENKGILDCEYCMIEYCHEY